MKHYQKLLGSACVLLALVTFAAEPPSGFAEPKKAKVQKNQNAGGQRLCLTSNGDIRTRGRCKIRKGEIAINSSNLPTIADIQFTGIPAGQTVLGVIGGDFDSAAINSTWGVIGSLPAQLDPSLTSADIIVASTTELLSACGGLASNCLHADELSASSTCTGTTTSPSAPEGKLCIYPFSLVNTTDINGLSAGTTAGAANGFEVRWTAENVGDTRFAAVYAYTAPDDE
jgi:hypothetical protein